MAILRRVLCLLRATIDQRVLAIAVLLTKTRLVERSPVLAARRTRCTPPTTWAHMSLAWRSLAAQSAEQEEVDRPPSRSGEENRGCDRRVDRGELPGSLRTPFDDERIAASDV